MTVEGLGKSKEKEKGTNSQKLSSGRLKTHDEIDNDREQDHGCKGERHVDHGKG